MTQTQAAATAERPLSPFEILGGEPVINAIVERFYDLMEGDPAYAELRAMHSPDLSYMRKSLAGFIVGWAGGPRTWFEERPDACMMSMHKPFKITSIVAGQWAEAMSRAIRDQQGVDPMLSSSLDNAMTAMALGMARD